MRKSIGLISVLLLFLAAGGLAAAAGAGEETQTAEEKAYQDVKILIFDQKWDEALAKLDGFLARFSGGRLARQAVYYRGKCLEEIGGRESEALAAYRAFLGHPDQSRSLVEEAEVSIIDLAMILYGRGDPSAWNELEARLTHPTRSVRQYAALRVSTLEDRDKAEMAVPILVLMAEKETNADLRDRAKIALLRIAPDRLSRVEDAPPRPRRARTLRFEVVEKGSRKVAMSLSLPWTLADLALSAVPDAEKRAMRLKGYDIPRIMRDLQASEGKILEFEAEDTLVRIWLEY
jgi:hypothetical protein